MQLKKYEAPTLQEALDAIKRELGPDAVILQTKRNRKGFGLMSKSSIEVTAAISEKSLVKKTYVENKLPEKTKEALRSLSATKQSELIETAVNQNLNRHRHSRVEQYNSQQNLQSKEQKVDQERHFYLEEEVKNLKKLLHDLKSAQEEKSLHQSSRESQILKTQALQDIFEQLTIEGVDKRLAYKLIKEVSFELSEDKLNQEEFLIEQLASEMMSSIPIISFFEQLKPNSQAILALVGPTGVGKTTTVAKIASHAVIKKNLKIGLINLDCFKVAAFDQLATYAKILNVPFRSCLTLEDLKVALAEFRALDLVLIDTTGRSQRDTHSLHEIKKILDTVLNIKIHLVSSITTRDQELYEISERFSIFKPEGVVLTKLDESANYGVIYNISQKTKKPLSFFTTGQKVPEDIEEATAERVVSLILEI